jgi:uncharacterized phage protein (predicted DNA packaging)
MKAGVLMLEEIKNYMRIDEDYDDNLINSLIEAASLYMLNAGVKNLENDLYKLAIKMLVLHWYENREIIGNANKLSFSLDNIITQLKYCYEVE